MQLLYDYLDFLPEWATPPVTALVVIIIGYFFSKIFAAIITSVFQTQDEGLAEGERGFGLKLARFIFWASWSFFIGIGISQFPIARTAIAKWHLSSSNLNSIIGIIPLTLILVLSEKILLQLGLKIKTIWKKIPFQKPLIITCILLFAVMASSAVSNPQYLSATIFLLSIGLMWSRTIREFISSGLDIFGADKTTQKGISQFSMYFVISTFLLTAFEIWI